MIIVNNRLAYTLTQFIREYFCLIDEEELETIMNLKSGSVHYIAGEEWMRVERK